MPGKRRDVALWNIITRTEYAEILKKARAGFGAGSEQGYVREPWNAIRDAALCAWEYLSEKRVSEFVGRQYGEDIYLGLTMDKWRLNKIGEKPVLQFYIRILKRGKRHKDCPSCQTKNSAHTNFCRNCGANLKEVPFGTKLKEVWKWKSIRMDDPFTIYIMDWLSYLQQQKYEGRIFAITRQRAWQIMNALGITNHINRHWRATHKAATMNIFELQEDMDRVTPPVEYVHGEPTKQLEKTEQADEIWK